MKIAIGVHGRFHSFDLARSLLRRGHDVTVFTNYPKWATARFGLPDACVRSFWQHGVLVRAAIRLQNAGIPAFRDEWLHPLFGRWLAAQVTKEGPWDIVHLWSGVAEELLEGPGAQGARLRLLLRGSAHIRTQAEILTEEELRSGTSQERPSLWMIAREEREYALADRIVVLSTFAHDSFTSRGAPPDRLSLLPLGAKLDTFRPTCDVIESRRTRILAGDPLRVLFVGTLSYRKGLLDLVETIRLVGRERFKLRLVGASVPEASALLGALPSYVERTRKQPQAKLPAVYAWGDIFVFPALEDGFAVVLAQAAASGLPIITTPNCGGPDLVREGESGWLVPIRDPVAIVDRLIWCDEHRSDLAAMMTNIYEHFRPRDWDDVAADFERLCEGGLLEITGAIR